MFRSNATIQTPNGSRYLTRLCRHWSHKRAVTYTPEAGQVAFDDGQLCTFEALPDRLSIEIRAADPESVAHLEQVVATHLLRMADRDALTEPTWTRSF